MLAAALQRRFVARSRVTASAYSTAAAAAAAATSAARRTCTKFDANKPLGAFIEGVNIASFNEDDIDFVQKSLDAHRVVFFKNQYITPTQHVAFALKFGQIQRHASFPHVEGYDAVTVLENDAARRSKIEVWHTDMTFTANPPLGSILHAIVCAERGKGNTEWLCTIAAYNALPPSMRATLDELSAVHSYEKGFAESLAEPGGRERLAPSLALYPPQTHPVVRTHPNTGEKGLFVNRLFTSHIVGMPRSESDALLEELYAHQEQSRFVIRLQWEVNMIAFWDNRCTQHRPINDFYPAHRKMQRVTVDDSLKPV